MKLNTEIEEIVLPEIAEKGVQLFMKRDDRSHPLVSGNKRYKLEYNLEAARQAGHRSILTFGGAFSNHLAATAAACHETGFRSIGIVRGEPVEGLNPTLRLARELGMELHFVTRSEFREYRQAPSIEKLSDRFSGCWVIPEGGANERGVRGAEEMYAEGCTGADILCVAMGTGTTFAGIARKIGAQQELLGFPVLKHENILGEATRWLDGHPVQGTLGIKPGFHFGGYARWNDSLLAFIREFHRKTGIALDPVYTGKLMFGVMQIIRSGRWQGKSILCFHTGGLQGIRGFEERFGLQLFEG